MSSSNSNSNQLLQGYFIEQTAKRMKQGFAKILSSKTVDVTVEQWVVLDTLGEYNNISQLEIAERTTKDPPTITRMLDLLESKQLLSRNPNSNDRRQFVISLTAKGKKLIQRIKPLSIEYRKQCYNSLKRTELDSLKHILEIINNNLQNI